MYVFLLKSGTPNLRSTFPLNQQFGKVFETTIGTKNDKLSLRKRTEGGQFHDLIKLFNAENAVIEKFTMQSWEVEVSILNHECKHKNMEVQCSPNRIHPQFLLKYSYRMVH